MDKSCTCFKVFKSTQSTAGKIRAKLSCSMDSPARIAASSNLRPFNRIVRGVFGRLSASSNVRTDNNVDFDLTFTKLSGFGKLNLSPNMSFGIIDNVSSESNVDICADKLGGSLSDINTYLNINSNNSCLQKLYPTKDIINDGFVNKFLSSEDIYESIDNGIGESHEFDNFIQPSSIYSTGEFAYKFNISPPAIRPEQSLLLFRAAGSIQNYSSRISPLYTFSNIKLEDPSGNLVIKYKDFTVRGDADFNTFEGSFCINAGTYITEPEINYANLHTWDLKYPLLGSGSSDAYINPNASGYTLQFNLKMECLDDPFNERFNFGYEDTCKLDFVNTDDDDYLAIDGAPLAAQSQDYGLNPSHTIRISAIEICNIGSLSTFKDSYLPFYSDVTPTGARISRTILPSEVLLQSFENDIYPQENSLWSSSPNIDLEIFDNTSGTGSSVLTSYIRNSSNANYITLDGTSHIADSGKLKLKFSHEAPTATLRYINGSLFFGNPAQINKNPDFDFAELAIIGDNDSFFEVDSLELHVVAKKAVGSRNYTLDVVGYSDDHLLNITSSIGGFLQNAEGSGSIPLVSGFNPIEDLGIASESLSDKSQFDDNLSVYNEGGDHYSLATTPIINSTTFQTYIIPLKIYPTIHELGLPSNYSSSSYFENLYLDIYPIPSGASISHMKLVVSHKPSNGLMLHSLGHGHDSVAKRTIKLYPSARKSNDKPINSCHTLSQLSNINNIPQGFSNPDNIKTNYSRRWRGVDGTVLVGPFKYSEFDFSFNNSQLYYPFLNGYFTFTNDENGWIVSEDLLGLPQLSGQYIGNYDKIENIGLRFNSNSLFSQPTNYTTIDWTSISGYNNDPLYGKISDSFNNAIRVSGQLGYINFGNIDTSSGFSIFTRFSPDINSNLFNSGIIYSKFNAGSDLEFALGFYNGKLTGYARTSNQDIVVVEDSLTYDQYTYPLSTLLIYNANNDNKLSLYTDIEHSGNFVRLRDQSDPFVLASGSNNLTFGYSPGFGIGINAFITDIGISTFNSSGTNIINSGQTSNILNRQLYADKFFDSLHMKLWESSESYTNDTYKLWDYVNEDTDLWHIGAFKICAFNQDYDRYTKRIGSDFLIHRLKHDGLPYELKTDLTLPSSIPSNVAYHSQIENDMLRFNIGSIPNANTFADVFYASDVRICKTLPRGYQFQEQAFVVETILEHETFDNIQWENGKVGPRLIVSLYTPIKEINSPSSFNAGLINRHIHYLESSGCLHKIFSTFDFDNLIDTTTEEWSSFDQSQNITEFDHKYYASDIDQMFLQYDLVYPSGSNFDSTIKLHSCHIKLQDALVNTRNENNTLLLQASGDYIEFDSLLLTGSDGVYVSGDQINLFAEAKLLGIPNDNIYLYCSGTYGSSSTLGLHSITVNFIDSLGSFGSSYGSLGEDPFTLFNSGGLNRFEDINLTLFNNETYPKASGSLILFVNNIPSLYPHNDYTILHTVGRDPFISRFPSELMNLFVSVDSASPIISDDINLYINGFNPNLFDIDDNLGLYTINYANTQLTTHPDALQTFLWNGVNVGQDIDVDDNSFATLSANDEIRGVETICYGNCANSGTCSELDLIVHETNWQPSDCVDGGIFRAIRTYTNLLASGFNTNVGYSGHFYGMRKFTGLVPDSLYDIVVVGRAGQDGYIEVPREISEWEYGTNNEVGYSGLKIIGDHPFATSGRQENDKYGHAVSVNGDLAAVGAPFHTLYDSGNYALDNAGAVFLYRRNPEPSGYDWSTQNHKSPWSLEAELKLPSEFIRDSYQTKTVNIANNFSVDTRIWHVGQEGREFGHAIDIAKPSGMKSQYGEDKELVIVSGPSAKWSRTFSEVEPSGVNIGLLVFTDRVFTPEIVVQREWPLQPLILSYRTILEAIQDRDLLFRYFTDPAIKFNIKIGICQAVTDPNFVSNDFGEPKPNFIIKQILTRHTSVDARNPVLFAETDNTLYSGIKDVYERLFPYDNTLINNNIPPLLGIFIDSSASLGEDPLQPALDRFIDHYQEHSFASGLQDFFGVPSSGEVIKFSNQDRNWIYQSIAVLNHVIDTGNLYNNDQLRFLTSGLREEGDSNLSEFNTPPDSGGVVYIFEKESGSWNIVQTIESPTISNIVPPDRFGHSIDISENGEIIVIGSPYIDDAVTVYEYDPSEKQKIYDNIGPWITYKKNLDTSFGYYYQAYQRYTELVQTYGASEAAKIFYVELTDNARYDLRHNRNYWNNNLPQEFKQIYKYGYKDIAYKGAWQFLIEDAAPTSRLGYSVATNDDGSIFAAGAPTDSFDEWDDADTYYAPDRPEYTTWHSYVNTGAVRLFESRKYFPHNLAIEYGKFGNRQLENATQEELPYFNHMQAIFNSTNINFTRTQFSDVDIPENAGLVFITTPDVDALSDEILTNIKNWLALGDRNLVLVGNDPVWESDGLYRTSNNIVNKILNSLGSRLRIQSARNEYEALLSGCNTPLNTIQSFRPTNSLSTYVGSPSLNAYGVGDIRVHWPENYNANYYSLNQISKIGPHPEAFRTYDCADEGGYDPNDPLSISSIAFDLNGQIVTYRSANSKCEIPLYHNGDLRSQWYEWCLNQKGEPITYIVNWPLYFRTVIESTYKCSNFIDGQRLTAGYDAVPIMAAAERLMETVVFKEVPATSGLVVTGFTTVLDPTSTSAGFGSPINNVDIIWTSGENGSYSGNYNLINTNVTNITNDSIFFNPEPYNEKDPILQSKAINNTLPTIGEQSVCDRHNFAMIENYPNKESSKVVCISSLALESSDFLDRSDDSNRLFYINLVRRSGSCYLAQLNDWTGRSTFKDANPDSYLKTVFNEFFRSGSFISVDENVSTDDLLRGTTEGYQYNVCWIANPLSLPSTEELNKLKSWLASGNKKLVITYDKNNNDYSTVTNVRQLCSLLGISMKPIWLTERNRYAISNIDKSENLLTNIRTDIGFKLNTSAIGYSEISSLNTVDTSIYTDDFIPLCGENATTIAYKTKPLLTLNDSNLYPVLDDKVIINLWQFKAGLAKVEFPVLPSSGYTLFFNIASEALSENQPIKVYIGNSTMVPFLSTPSYVKYMDIKDYDENYQQYIVEKDFIVSDILELTPLRSDGVVHTYSTSVQMLPSKDKLVLYFDGNDLQVLDQEARPRTTRLISVSGCLTSVVPVGYINVPIYDWKVTPAIPERTVVQEVFRQISTDNSKYCPDDSCVENLGNQPIADGPIIVAQELEVFSPFENGVNRSRITVISDSSLIQGRCIADENGAIYPQNIQFIQSLYPFTSFPGDIKGRYYNVKTKIKSSEFGSPQRYFNAIGNSGLNLRFDASGVEASGRLMSDFIESFSGYDTFIRTYYPTLADPAKYIVERTSPFLGNVSELLSGIKQEFRNSQASWGGSSKFMGLIDGEYYEDANIKGGMPKVMVDTGHDYLDFDYFMSGYPGDLFGYSIALYGSGNATKLLVGAPFSAYTSESITKWEDIVNNTNRYERPSGTEIGFNGGAGSAYLFERTSEGITPYGYPTKWECVRKFRPNSINVGQDLTDPVLASGGYYLGPHNYTSEELSHLSIVPDQFGYKVTIDGDIIAIGAPGHDFDSFVETIYNSGEFIRKEFDFSLDIPVRNIYDMGASGVRNELYGSGITVLNNGAIYTYENRITNWENKTKSWEYVEKIVPQGYNSRENSENDYFGKSISINRSKRLDADYSIIAGSPSHKYATSGNHISSQPLIDAGASYIYDGMLRKLPESKADPDTWIKARIFGNTNTSGVPSINIEFNNNILNAEYIASGTVRANYDGEIYIEASGQDKVLKGFIAHRPYIELVQGSYIFGTNYRDALRLYIDGQASGINNNMNLFSNASNSANVYNNLGLYESAIIDYSSGNIDLYVKSEAPEALSSEISLYASGVGTETDTLNMRIRGY